MSNADNLEELKKRKEQLLLEQEIAKLERKQELSKAAGWNWWWVAPVTAVGAFLFIAGVAEGSGPPIVFGLIALVPVALKLYFKRSIVG